MARMGRPASSQSPQNNQICRVEVIKLAHVCSESNGVDVKRHLRVTLDQAKRDVNCDGGFRKAISVVFPL